MLIAVSFAAAACAPTARYRALTFFFDGVPVPPGVEIEAPEFSPAASISPFRQQINAIARPVLAPAVKILSVHKPYAERECNSCHTPSMNAIEELPRDSTLCDQCHYQQRTEQGWNHGPINLGTCVPCHKPHNSVYPNLLDKPVPELCLQCHEQDLARDKEYHLVENVNDCTACHDPHRMY